jgi:hypothetical protein
MKREPYVISDGIRILLKEWGQKRGFKIPENSFFKDFRKELQNKLEEIFGRGNVDIVSAEELKAGAEKFICQTGLPFVSMDRVCIRTNPAIEVTRVVDKDDLNDCGIAPRFGTLPLQKQLLIIKEKFTEIALWDDVIFSGKVISEIILSLEEIGVKVVVVVAGITTGKGYQNLKEKTDVRILTVRYYEEVTDQICMRDFRPGVPLCGRSITGMPIDVGVPYLLPFAIDSKGKSHLKDWASIPEEHQKEFSRFCLEQTIRLWEEIEKCSQRIVRCRDLERIPLGFHQHYYKSRFVDCLKACLKKLS